MAGGERANSTLSPSTRTDGQTLYRPPEGTPAPGAMYPRVERLAHADTGGDVLIATFEHYWSTDPENASQPFFPVYRSTDGGESWTKCSEIHDTENDWGLRYQPTLFELPVDVGPWSAGTILAAGNSIPDDLSRTKIDVYASEDRGQTWEYVSTVAEGGQAVPQAGSTPVWEPDFALDPDGNLVVYFADERHRDEGYNQLIGHRVSEDGGQTWGEEVFDAAIPNGEDRPGMPVVTRLPDGRYVMVFEVVGPTHEGGIFVMASPDGRSWGDPADVGSPVMTTAGYQGCNGPYATWTPAGGTDGTLLVSAKTLRDENREQAPGSGDVLLATHDFESFSDWRTVSSPITYDDELDVGYQMVAWTTPLLPSPDGERLLAMSSTYVGPERLEIRYGIDELDVDG
ncbi:Putative bifunctional protein Secreted sugar binding protein-sugar hydrolase [Halorhabdus tiamatea SARL4B]|nr:Putative bifunctional protein Secreted sugar binding protein-sugar hydrolase [Halorhabdus tiamatea SARL4B]